MSNHKGKNILYDGHLDTRCSEFQRPSTKRIGYKSSKNRGNSKCRGFTLNVIIIQFAEGVLVSTYTYI